MVRMGNPAIGEDGAHRRVDAFQTDTAHGIIGYVNAVVHQCIKTRLQGGLVDFH